MEGTRGSGEDAVCAATLDRPRSGLAWAQGKWRLRRYAAESIPPSLPAARMGGGRGEAPEAIQSSVRVRDCNLSFC